MGMSTVEAASPLSSIRRATAEILRLPEDDLVAVDFLVSIIVSNLWTPDADPLWGWLIGPPGSFKTELTRTLEEYRHVKYLSSVSPAALCSGYDPDKSHEDVSLLKHLDRKILVIKDFTVMLSAKESDIQKIFGDLRDAFDGSFAKWFGTVGWRRYKAKFGVIAAVTPEIDNFTIQHIVLGERFLSLRVCRRGLRDRQTRLALLRHVREAIPAKARWRQALKTTWHNNLDAILEGLPGTVDLPEDYGVRIELLSDQKRYKVGDQAKILIKSPYEEATALISLEREGIIRHWTELVVGSAPTISIPIVEDCIPNLFVSVILLEGRRGFTDGGDVGRPSFKIGYIELPVDPESRSLTVEVETDKREYRPGEEVRMRYWVKDFRGRPRQAEVAVAVVDEGVLALTAFPTPNPFDFFYRHRPLSVLTSEPLIHLIEQRNYGEKGEDLGGAGGIEALAGVELRKNFIYCAYWNPLLETDSQGRGEVKFRLPDNLTRFRVMVIAQTSDSKFGAGETHLKVKKPLLLRPSLPRFLRVGDRIEAGVVAQNFTGRDAPILLRAEAEGVRIPPDARDRNLRPIGDLYPGFRTSMLQDILDKTLTYDEFTMPDPSYLAEVTLIAGMDSSHGSTWGNGQINYGTTYYFNAAHGIESHTYLYPGSGSSESQIIANLNDGVSYINYTAHGDVTYWYDPYISQSNVNSLTNYGKYCTAVGNCCLTSTYDYGECFAETWLRAADKGAIGYIGGSNSTYWDEDYYWGVGYGSIVSNPTYEATGLGAYDGVFHDHGEAMTQWYVCNDALIFAGNLAVVESGSSRVEYYWNIYNLMGDPSISTYMGVPGSNPVAHEDNIEDDATSFTVAAAAGSYVGLSQDGDLVGAGSIGASGTADIAVWNLNAGGGDVQIVVMAQNYEPYITTISMGPSAQPEIAVAPGFFDVTLYQGGAATETLEISNVGEANSLLEYSISISGHADWLDIPVTSGTVGEGDTDYLNVNFSASGLGVGDYSVDIQIAHNGTDGTVFVPVDLHVETGGTDAEEIPAIMLLRGNYPNPFNPKTTIQFSLPESGMVNLVVFDVKGQKVATLADGMLDAGDHHIVWEGLNDANEPVPSGLYFYTLDTGSGKATRKMLMLK